MADIPSGVDVKRLMAETVRDVCIRHLADGTLDLSKASCEVANGIALSAPDQWWAYLEEIAVSTIKDQMNRFLAKLCVKSDAEQCSLDFGPAPEMPGFETDNELVRFHDRVAWISSLSPAELEEFLNLEAARLQSYEYPKRSEDGLKSDKDRYKRLRQIQKAAGTDCPTILDGLRVRVAEVPLKPKSGKAQKRARRAGR